MTDFNHCPETKRKNMCNFNLCEEKCQKRQICRINVKIKVTFIHK